MSATPEARFAELFSEMYEICQKQGKISGHHWHGYDRVHWLDVLWLCNECHTWHERCMRENERKPYHCG